MLYVKWDFMTRESGQLMWLQMERNGKRGQANEREARQMEGVTVQALRAKIVRKSSISLERGDLTQNFR